MQVHVTIAHVHDPKLSFLYNKKNLHLPWLFRGLVQDELLLIAHRLKHVNISKDLAKWITRCIKERYFILRSLMVNEWESF